ncbi:hypothetical protein ACFFLM_21320 [Deinococcus oregonensis]|uniref:Uncharacterized protein n=1 Tax=Deinococcus oregonensis TaxID=1805970 RepID=A0ABV6B425_9DEIO
MTPTLPAVQIDGWAHWQLLEGGRVIQEGEQHNLLLNQGLDLMATYGLGDVPNGNNVENTGIQQYLVVGTGSTAPAVDQLNMVAEVARSAYAPPGFACSVTRTGAGIYRRTVTREFFGHQANGNLTEWGFSPQSGFNSALAVRELFRDNNGTPIVLTKTAAQQLRLTYTLEYRFGPTVTSAASFDISGIGNVSGKYSIHRQSTVYSPGFTPLDMMDYLLMNGMVRGEVNAFILTGRGADPVYTNLGGEYGAAPMSLDSRILTTSGVYTPGSFTRRQDLNYGTGNGNQTHYGWALGIGSQNINSYNFYGSGYTFQLDPGSEITTKDNLKTLSITGLGATWGRA